MKIRLAVLLLCSFFAAACTSSNNARIVMTDIETKGTATGNPTPEWFKIYLDQGVSGLQAMPQYSDKYCIVGEANGTNRSFVLSWADQASAQQRIGALLRTNVASRYSAAVTASSLSTGSPEEASGQFSQEIDNIVNTLVNVSYSGAQREADWWVLRERHDTINNTYSEEYIAFVLYTVPRTELNRQIAFALENSVSKDSELYDITIGIARDILLQGYDESEIQNADAIVQTAEDSYNPPGGAVALALDELPLSDEYLVGRDIAASILGRYKPYTADPELTEYVNKICTAIVVNSPDPVMFNGYHVMILDTDEVNAFASPGGHILVTRGLVSSAESEDSLAAVIAHEIAHVQLRHGLRAIQTNRDMEDWLSQFTDSGAEKISDRINAGFSQVQEFDADITAVALLASTGYSPQEFIVMIQGLQEKQAGAGGGFNSTHPSPTARLVNARIACNRYARLPDNSMIRQERFERAAR
jgi:hypothetical protein